MRNKAILSLLIFVIMIFYTVPAFAEKNLSANSSTMSYLSQPENFAEVEQFAETLINMSEFEVGEERVFYADDQHTLSIELTSIEEPSIIPATTSVRTPNYNWTITTTNAFGIKYTIFEAMLYATYVPDGWDGYIINLHGQLSNIHDLWTVKWDSAYTSTAKFLHSLGVTIKSGLTEGDAIWFASYSPFDSTCVISKD